MKYRVREGFVATIKEVVEVEVGPGRKSREVQETRVFGGKVAEFDEANALANLHMLEAVDRDAKDLVERVLDNQVATADRNAPPAAA